VALATVEMEARARSQRRATRKNKVQFQTTFLSEILLGKVEKLHGGGKFKSVGSEMQFFERFDPRISSLPCTTGA
jgi:hypothetical protein